jgi:hypothetical protein
MIVKYSKRDDESREEYIHRICGMQPEIGDWESVSDIIRKELNEDYDESAYRKPYQAFEKYFEAIKHKLIDGELMKELDLKKDTLYKQQVKTADRMREHRKTLRDEARVENLIDAIRESSENYITVTPNYSLDLIHQEDGNEAIVMIGDWHVGDEFYNFRNEYNVDILKQRVESLIEQTVEYAKLHNVTKLNFINVGDLIGGNIHGSIRVEAELLMVDQIKVASALVFEVLKAVSEKVKHVTYRSSLDNHSRMNKDYHEHIEKESFASLIDWWLEAKIEATNTRVEVIKDNLDPNIGYFQLNNGKNVFFVHGHQDQVNTIIQNLTFGTNIICDIALLGHYHTDKMKSFQGKKVYLNGTLKGTDSYALNKRLFGDVTQTMLVFDKKNTIDIRMNL